VYPTYFALPYLKASNGSIVVTASVAGRVPSARMSFYNVRTVQSKLHNK
jgi:short-subunit dehydrogenase